jgi:hypothetical protein
MEDVGMFWGHVVYFTAFWFTLWASCTFFGTFCGLFFPVLVCCGKLNLATLFGW